jgi:hypothetical protein
MLSPGARIFVVAAGIVSAAVFIGVAVTEINYVSGHPYAYGPAKVIAWGAGAGALLSAALALLAFQLGSTSKVG